MKKRYWLRGGIIGLIAGTAIGLYFTGMSCHVSVGGTVGYCPDGSTFAPGLEFILTLPILFLYSSAPFFIDSNFYLLEIISIALILSLVGMFLGWLYGKMKNRYFSISTTNY